MVGGEAGQLTILTIGHSNLEIQTFLDHLKRHHVETLVDVRSQPSSQMYAQYNRTMLARWVESAGVEYVFMGDSLGGRPRDQSLYLPNGHADYVKIALTQAYQKGLEALLQLARGRRVAIMCSEGDFQECHRYHLISKSLSELGVQVSHIVPDGSLVEDPPHQTSFLAELT